MSPRLSGVQGQNPCGGLGVKPPEAEDIYANNNCNNALTKHPKYFFSMGISEGDVSLVPLPYASVHGRSLKRIWGIRITIRL